MLEKVKEIIAKQLSLDVDEITERPACCKASINKKNGFECLQSRRKLPKLFLYAVIPHQLNDIANGCDSFQVFRGNLNVILLLKRHHQLKQIQGIRGWEWICRMT